MAKRVYARPGRYAGYDCDITPAQVYEAVTKALEAGVDRLWCGREWDELSPDNAKAFGDDFRAWMRKR
ncbi:MAG: hypothetical protein R3C61_00975 [Bacteroidia bacterium]